MRDGWKCTDQENGIVCHFKIHRFNETQQFEFNTDVDPDAAVIAKALREMGDWLSANLRITKEAADILNAQPNKSEFIDNLIKKSV